MIDWFLELAWYWEVLVAILAANIVLLWGTLMLMGATIGAMANDSDSLGPLGAIGAIILGAVVGPFVLIYQFFLLRNR